MDNEMEKSLNTNKPVASAKNGKKSKAEHKRDFVNMPDEEILGQVMADLKASEDFQTPFFTKFDELYRKYRSYIEDSKRREHGANLFIPYSFHAIETVMPKIILSIFNSKPYVHTVPLGVDTKVRAEKSEAMNKLLDYHFENKIDIINKMTRVMRAMLTYGTAVTKQVWRYEVKKAKKRQQTKIFGVLPIPGAFETVTSDTIVRDHPDIVHIPLKDFFFDPSATDIETCRYAIHRYWEDKSELLKLQEQGILRNVDELEDNEKSSPSGMEKAIGRSAKKNRGVEIIEYWTPDSLVKIADRKVVVYVSDNIYHHGELPFTLWRDVELEGEFYGIGELEPIGDLQEELNTTRNQRIDNVSLIINNMWKVLRGSSLKEEDLISRPNGIIEVDDMDEIEPLTKPDVSNSAYNEEVIIKQDMDRTLGIYDSVRGSNPARRETATTSTILATAGGERFQLKVKCIVAGGMKRAVSQIIQLEQQFVDTTTEINLLSEDGIMQTVKVAPELILGEYDLAAVGSITEPILNKEIRQQYLTQLFAMVQASPIVNQQEYLRRLFQAFDFKDIDALFIQQAPIPQMPGMPGQQPMMGPQVGTTPMDASMAGVESLI